MNPAMVFNYAIPVSPKPCVVTADVCGVLRFILIAQHVGSLLHSY